MANNCLLHLICVTALIYCYCQALPISSEVDEDPFEMHISPKRAAFKKLRPNNPLLIFHQSIRQPRYLSSIPLSKPDVGKNYNIPRRWVRRGANNKTKISPLLIWNHQLLPRFLTHGRPSQNYFNLHKNNDNLSVASKRSAGWLRNLSPEAILEDQEPFKSNEAGDLYEFDYDDRTLPEFENEDD